MINPERGWFFWGVGPKRKFTDHSYLDESIRGICAGNVYEPYNCKHNGGKFDASKFGNCEVDMYLDLDKKELRMSVVGKDEKDSKYAQEAIWYGVSNDSGWVPHFNFSAYFRQSQKVQIAKVPLEWYGKPAKVEWNIQ